MEWDKRAFLKDLQQALKEAATEDPKILSQTALTTPQEVRDWIFSAKVEDEKIPDHVVRVAHHLFEAIRGFRSKGYSSEHILEAIEVPSTDIGVWWAELCHNAHWKEDVAETLEILAIPGMKEKLLEGMKASRDELIGCEALGWWD